MKLTALIGVLLTVLLPSAQAPSAEELVAAGESRFFVSNGLGMMLRELDPGLKQTSDYLLEVMRRGEAEISRLYHKGEEIKRWETLESEERIFIRGMLEEKRMFDSAGRLVEEQSYRLPGGSLLQRVVYRYSSGALRATETYDGQGNLLYTNHYRISPEGRLLEVWRDEAESESQWLSFRGWEGRIVEEFYSRGTEELLYRYEADGRAVGKEFWRDGEPVSRERYRYAAEASAANAAAGGETAGTVDKLLDARGRVVKQIVYVDGVLIEEASSYDEAGRRVRLLRSGPEGLEETVYVYTDSGQLSREEFRRRGQVRQITVYREDGLRVSELYREGLLFLRATYQNERLIREEFYEEGRVVRTREM